ncbi:hypothetical protein MPTK1_4g02630 [Marchantia polymorpha subsp. ruderalis]
MQSMSELEENLTMYEGQLQQVKELHEAEPDSAEYEDMHGELEEGSTTEQHARQDLCRSCFARARRCEPEAQSSTVQISNQ